MEVARNFMALMAPKKTDNRKFSSSSSSQNFSSLSAETKDEQNWRLTLVGFFALNGHINRNDKQQVPD